MLGGLQGAAFNLAFWLQMGARNETSYQFIDPDAAGAAPKPTDRAFADLIDDVAGFPAYPFAGVNYSFADLVKLYTMASFKTLNLQTADSKTPMTYYGNWRSALAKQTTAALVSSGAGMCAAWSRFFLDALGAQGIDVGPAALLEMKSPNKSVQLYVKNWKPVDATPNNPGADKATYPYLNTYSARPGQNAGLAMIDFAKPGYSWTLEKVKKQPGVFGQGDSEPLAVFSNHVVTNIVVGGDQLFFDPSYGNTYNTSRTDDTNRRMQDFQNTALDFLGQHTAVVQADGSRVVTVRFRPMKPDTELKLIAVILRR